MCYFLRPRVQRSGAWSYRPPAKTYAADLCHTTNPSTQQAKIKPRKIATLEGEDTPNADNTPLTLSASAIFCFRCGYLRLVLSCRAELLGAVLGEGGTAAGRMFFLGICALASFFGLRRKAARRRKRLQLRNQGRCREARLGQDAFRFR